jgi:Na+-transporting NADH:ubiquinone oxidoreductase subunit NqrD
MLSEYVFPSETAEILIYIQCMVANSLILERFDKRSLRKRSQKFLFIVCSTAGFDIALLLFAAFREIIAYGSLYGHMVALEQPLPVFGYIFGGMILLGIFAGLFRFIIGKLGVHEH